MSLEADRKPLSATGEASELVKRALIGWNLRRQVVVLVANEVIEGFRAVFVDQLLQFVDSDRFANLGLGHGVADQRMSLLAGADFV